MRSATRWTAIGGLALLAFLGFPQLVSANGDTGALGLGGGTVVQNSNSSIGSVAASGPAIGVNVAASNAGPQANALLGFAQTSQIGNNTSVTNQNSTVKSGDAVAGSQVTGVVGGGPTVVQNQNSSLGALALSGPAIGGNVAVSNTGPSANALLGAASAQQFGNNTSVVNQTNVTKSGDALAGSQVTGVVGGFGTVVQNSNSSIASFAFTGPAIGGNIAVVPTGPSANALLGFANASQFGDNTAILTQTNIVHSGDALAGSQSTGVVGGGPGFVGGSNFGFLPFAVSGLVVGGNTAFGGPGPAAGPSFLGFASTSQAGNNFLDAAQFNDLASGDGVSGSQVNGLVSQERGAVEKSSRVGADIPASANEALAWKSGLT